MDEIIGVIELRVNDDADADGDEGELESNSELSTKKVDNMEAWKIDMDRSALKITIGKSHV